LPRREREPFLPEGAGYFLSDGVRWSPSDEGSKAVFPQNASGTSLMGATMKMKPETITTRERPPEMGSFRGGRPLAVSRRLQLVRLAAARLSRASKAPSRAHRN